MQVARAEVWGSPISHSLSPALHRAAYAWLGLQHDYGAREVSEETWAAAWAEHGRTLLGLSVTMPLKGRAAATADRRSDVVELLGVANTLVPTREGVLADNTDATALLRLLAGTDLSEVLLVGGGATAASVLWALARLGADAVRVATRSGPRPVLVRAADALDIRLDAVAFDAAPCATTLVLALPASARDAYLASEVGGVQPERSAPAGPRAARTGATAVHGRGLGAAVAVDIAYPGGTAARRLLESHGWSVRDGRELLVEQARDQVRLMTGRDVPASVLVGALPPA